MITVWAIPWKGDSWPELLESALQLRLFFCALDTIWYEDSSVERSQLSGKANSF